MLSLARRIVDARVLHLIKMWLECAVEETDDRGRKTRTTEAKDQRRGIPQGSPISPLLANLYMRRFVLGWKKLGLEQSLGSPPAPRPVPAGSRWPAAARCRPPPVGPPSHPAPAPPWPEPCRRSAGAGTGRSGRCRWSRLGGSMYATARAARSASMNSTVVDCGGGAVPACKPMPMPALATSVTDAGRTWPAAVRRFSASLLANITSNGWSSPSRGHVHLQARLRLEGRQQGQHHLREGACGLQPQRRLGCQRSLRLRRADGHQ